MKEISFMNAICVRKSVILKCVQLFEANRNYEYNVVNVWTDRSQTDHFNCHIEVVHED